MPDVALCPLSSTANSTIVLHLSGSTLTRNLNVKCLCCIHSTSLVVVKAGIQSQERTDHWRYQSDLLVLSCIVRTQSCSDRSPVAPPVSVTKLWRHLNQNEDDNVGPLPVGVVFEKITDEVEEDEQ